MPFLTCIVLSHDKAAYVGDALNSLVAQTFPDWEAVVFDSGVLYDQGFFDHLPAARDPRIRLVRSWETDELRRIKTIASWCFNECFRKKLVQGRYVTYLCDDDLLYPNAFQAFYDYLRCHPDAKALYASVDLTGLNAQGEKCRFREILAHEVKGSCCGGGELDNHVDYLQLCHEADLLKRLPDDEYWPEDRTVIRHADGIFLEKIGSLVPIYPVKAKIGENRKVPVSLNDGGERLEFHLRLRRLEDEREGLYLSLLGLRAENDRLLQAQVDLQGRWQQWSDAKPVRYRVADKLNNTLRRVPLVHAAGKRLMVAASEAWKWTARASRSSVTVHAKPDSAPEAGGTKANGNGVHYPVHATPASRPRVKPHLLLVTEKWCDGNPKAGVTNNESNLFGSLSVANLATHDQLYLDEYYLQYGQNCDDELLHRCRTDRPDAVIACHLFGSERNVRPQTWEQVHALGIPIVFLWFDAVLESRMRLADSLTSYAALSLVLDTAAYKTDFPDKYLSLWTPQDPRYFFNPHGPRPLDVCFLGSREGYPDRSAGLGALHHSGIDVFQAGGQREQPLPLDAYTRVLKTCKICLNFSRLRGGLDLVQAKGRIFEATLCGALLLDAENDQTRRWFTPAEEYVPFADEHDLVEKVKHYLEHEDQRESIARRGWLKAVTSYNSYRFWQTVLDRIGVK
jgi:glycosyltransferase involved in cell wall biosynthesis